ncbi:hypothetical protein FHR93_000647 [Geodermatophilus sabuli]|uniref:Uncharacterized protein n=1 Tax=Geodermatophilus sabuli TaxID=1564158 RepID=A0A285E8Y1_9ACTN|nr:hypothetical protein [Geodermatophilus sabuli]SNX94664.1 hypothetical protein SAMN06893097_101461 [Geodermatophilus sabuli]
MGFSSGTFGSSAPVDSPRGGPQTVGDAVPVSEEASRR